jgi:Gluconolactonase
MSEVRILATGLGFPEGPVAMPDGSVILTEIRNNRCSRVTPDGKVSLFSATGGGPNGLAVGPDGALYLCNNGGSRYVEGVSMGQGPHPDYKGGSIQRLDRATGAATTLYSECDGHRLSAPNDIVFDKAGGFYFTDLGKRYARHRDHGGLYYALPDGSKIVSLAYPMLSPNGCGLSPDGKTLYAADTEGARLWAFDVEGRRAAQAQGPRTAWRAGHRRIAGPGALRQPGGDGQRQRRGGDADDRDDHGDLASRRDRARREDAGYLSDQHLLRRIRHADGLYNAVGLGPAWHPAVARARAKTQFQLTGG